MSVPKTSFTIQIPTALMPRITAAFCAAYGYQTTLPDGTANPKTPMQFTHETVRQIIRQTVISHETQLATIAAQATVDAATVQAQTEIELS